LVGDGERGGGHALPVLDAVERQDVAHGFLLGVGAGVGVSGGAAGGPVALPPLSVASASWRFWGRVWGTPMPVLRAANMATLLACRVIHDGSSDAGTQTEQLVPLTWSTISPRPSIIVWLPTCA